MLVRVLAERRVRRVFAALSASDWDAVVEGLSPQVRHAFPGESAIGGARVGVPAVRRWLERLGRLFPGHEFEVHTVATSGAPWDLRIAVQWIARLTPVVGERYENHGAHWLEVRWGRVTAFHAYLDTERIARACRELQAAGVDEAGAPPLT